MSFSQIEKPRGGPRAVCDRGVSPFFGSVGVTGLVCVRSREDREGTLIRNNKALPSVVRRISVGVPMSELKSGWQLVVMWGLVTAVAAVMHFAPIARLLDGLTH